MPKKKCTKETIITNEIVNEIVSEHKGNGSGSGSGYATGIINTNAKDTRPWVEKYRPARFEDIVLEPLTSELLTKMLDSGNLPNMLMYGPPGTGKTTTIMNLVAEYKRRKGESPTGHVIHLNASDERGIDIVRGPISQFVNSNNLFRPGIKVVILDEADYMTEAAQHALRQLLQTSTSVRFCLICNYVSKIDESLRNEFVRIRFNQLPKEHVVSFLGEVALAEGLTLTREQILSIQGKFGSDIRSMINFMQLNHDSLQPSENPSEVIEQPALDLPSLMDSLKMLKMSNGKPVVQKRTRNKILEMMTSNIDSGTGLKNMVRDIVHHIIIHKPNWLSIEFLSNCEFLLHHPCEDHGTALEYFICCCVVHIQL